jgi:hypothetical protein
MQTFLAYPALVPSAACLDQLRCGNQRNEVLVILRTLRGEIAAWRNHAAVRMWRGHEQLLVRYGLAVCAEWRRRGFSDVVRHAIAAFLRPGPVDIPAWWGGPIHASHRSNLLRKNPGHYRQFGWTEPDDLPYFWPEQKLERYTTQNRNGRSGQPLIVHVQ